jgi:hypothetical protein
MFSYWVTSGLFTVPCPSLCYNSIGHEAKFLQRTRCKFLLWSSIRRYLALCAATCSCLSRIRGHWLPTRRLFSFPV